MTEPRKRIADFAFLMALMLYILWGVPLVPAHGDEFMQMSLARDYFSLNEGNFAALYYTPPIERDTQQYLRILNGTVNQTAVGFLWRLSGRTAEQLPEIYAWAMPYSWNQENNRVPDSDALLVARWASVIFTALGVIPIFLLGWHLRLRSLAYPAALLYALHPVILMNGRRAMMEGSLLFFSLMSLYWLVALIVAEHSTTARGFMVRLPAWMRYGGLGLLLGFCLAAKHTGVVTAAAVLITVFIAAMVRDKPYQWRRPLIWATVTSGLMALTFLLLTPAYWNRPVDALQATLSNRVELLSLQSEGDLRHATIIDRLVAIVQQPFLTPPQYSEAPNWAGVIEADIARYQASATNGFDWGMWIGIGLSGLAVVGLWALIRDALRRDLIAWTILIWTAAQFAAALTIPVNWQRYYLMLTIVGIILAAAGMGRLLVRREIQSAAPTLQGQVQLQENT